MKSSRRVVVVVVSISMICAVLVAGGSLATGNSEVPGAPDAAFLNQIKANDGISGGQVTDLAVQTDGKIVVVGAFTSAAGLTGVNRIARFNANGAPDTAFNEVIKAHGGLNNTVNAVALQNDGGIVVTGAFQNAAGQAGVRGLARFDSTGASDVAFNTKMVGGSPLKGLNVGGEDLTIQSDGKIVVGGGFSIAGGMENVKRLARFEANGDPDTNFNGEIRDNGGFDGVIQSLAIQGTSIVVIGSFTSAHDVPNINRIARVLSDGSPDVDFNTAIEANGGLNAGPSAVTVQTDGKIVVGGEFTNAGGIVGVNGVARFADNGSTDTSFNNAVKAFGGIATDSSSRVLNIAVQPNGSIVAVGRFSGVGSVAGVNRLARLNSNGTSDVGFNNQVKVNGGLTGGAQPTVAALGLGNGNRIIVGGSFSNAAGVTPVNRLAMFNGVPTSPPVPPKPPAPKVVKPNKPASLKVKGKRTAKTYKASWKVPKGTNSTTRPVARYTLTVTVKGKKRTLIKKTLSSSKRKYNFKRATLKRVLKKYKVRSAKRYRFTVRVIASNKAGKSTAAAKAFTMNK